MKHFEKEDSYGVFTWIAILLCIPAFLINLGKGVLIGDEAIRSLVALEMMLSHNYIVPTMEGQFYFAKPPLYNWVLIGFFKMIGSVSEFSARFPTVLFSFTFAWLIWWLTKDRFKNKKHALLLAMMFLTCGRMVFYDSFLGLIDIFFSMVTFTMIILAYICAEKGYWTRMYVIMYTLSTIGFMLKGLPSIHFLIIGLLVIHWQFGSWLQLAKIKHIVPLLLSIAIVTTYFYIYNQYMDASRVVSPLVDQATRRTFFRYDLIAVLKHVLTYPFENIFHFFPWSILGILAFRKDILPLLRADKFIWYCTISFLFNFLLYWISPEVFPRYILMLIPLIFIVWVYLYEFEIGKNDRLMWMISILFKVIVVIVPFLVLSQYFNHLLAYTLYGKQIVIILTILLALVAILYFKLQRDRPMIFVIYILLLRIGFNLTILPVRAEMGDDEVIRREAVRIGSEYKNKSIAILEGSKLNHLSAFYITNTTKKILPVVDNFQEADFFIIDSSYMYLLPAVDSFPDSESCGTRWIITPPKH